MVNLLKSDFYKLFKNKMFIVLSIISLGLSLVITIGSYALVAWFGNGLTVDLAASISKFIVIPGTLIGIPLLTFLFMYMFSASSSSNEFSYGTIKNVISKGFSRSNVYFSRVITATIGNIILWALYVIPSIILILMFYPNGVASPGYTEYIIKLSLIALLHNVAVSFIGTMFAFVFRKGSTVIIWTLSFYVFFGVVLSAVSLAVNKIFNLTGASILVLQQYTPENAFKLMLSGFVLYKDYFMTALIVLLVYIVIAAGISIWNFSKRDV